MAIGDVTPYVTASFRTVNFHLAFALDRYLNIDVKLACLLAYLLILAAVFVLLDVQRPSFCVVMSQVFRRDWSYSPSSSHNACYYLVSYVVTLSCVQTR